MRCPRCKAEMVVTHLHGVEIDRCPDCQGLWLDGGELQKIVGRGQTASTNTGQSDLILEDLFNWH